MSEAFIGEIRAFPHTFATQDWLECNGQMVAVQQYQALYAVIGQTYGGSGNTTFALPNLAGCAAVGMGQGPSLSAYTLGRPPAGATAVTLTPAELPNHRHTLTAKLGPDASPGQVKRIRTEGAYAYVTKPIDFEQMFELLDEILVASAVD